MPAQVAESEGRDRSLLPPSQFPRCPFSGALGIPSSFTELRVCFIPYFGPLLYDRKMECKLFPKFMMRI